MVRYVNHMTDHELLPFFYIAGGVGVGLAGNATADVAGKRLANPDAVIPDGGLISYAVEHVHSAQALGALQVGGNVLAGVGAVVSLFAVGKLLVDLIRQPD